MGCGCTLARQQGKVGHVSKKKWLGLAAVIAAVAAMSRKKCSCGHKCGPGCDCKCDCEGHQAGKAAPASGER
jgi:hypothetical protein